MDWSELPTTPTRREIQLQGPRPAPLRVNKESHKIRKPPIPPTRHHVPPSENNSRNTNNNQPVIIYSVSPKPIHVDASNFMSIVQRLTGRESTSASESHAPVFPSNDPHAPPSPAARLAAIERTSPKERERRVAASDETEGGFSQMPGILSLAPENLPGISPAMFSPGLGGLEGQNSLFAVNDWLLSPFMSNSGNNLSFLPSPSALFLSNASMVSPTPSPGAELFNIFDFS